MKELYLFEPESKEPRKKILANLRRQLSEKSNQGLDCSDIARQILGLETFNAAVSSIHKEQQQ